MGKYYHLVLKEFWSGLRPAWGEQLIGALAVVLIYLCQVHFGLIVAAQRKANVLSIAWPYLLIFGGYFLFHAIKAPWKVHQENESQNRFRESTLRDEANRAHEAKLEAENRYRELTDSRWRRGEWKRLEVQFIENFRSGTGSMMWSRNPPSEGIDWRFLGGWEPIKEAQITAVMAEAGSLLLRTSYMHRNLAHLLTENDPMQRWLGAVFSMAPGVKETTGTARDGTVSVQTGQLWSVPEACSHVCALMASWEFVSMPKD